MKQEVSPPILIGAVAVILLLIGVIGWLVFGSSSNSGSAEQLKAAQARKAKRDE